MSVGVIVTGGFGTGTYFGAPFAIVTEGFSVGEITPDPPPFYVRILSFGPNRLYPEGNTQFFSCTVVREGDTRELVDDADVELNVYTYPGGNLVTGATWPLTLESTGDQYEGELSADAELESGKQYKMVVSATRAGLKSTYEQVVTCRARVLP